jgi:hypothetical protein
MAFLEGGSPQEGPKVRIHLPPAGSLRTFGSCVHQSCDVPHTTKNFASARSLQPTFPGFPASHHASDALYDAKGEDRGTVALCERCGEEIAGAKRSRPGRHVDRRRHLVMVAGRRRSLTVTHWQIFMLLYRHRGDVWPSRGPTPAPAPGA